MTASEISKLIEKSYKENELVYEMMISHFSSLSNIPFHTVTLKKGSPIIRARYSKNLESFKNLSDISYPKIEYVKEFSRLNRPKQNLFYASESEIACITEMLPFWLDDFKTGDLILVTLCKWIIRNDLKLIVIPDVTNLNNLNKNIINRLQQQELLFWNYISEKFRTSTKEDKKIYEFTSAFSNVLWLNAIKQDLNASGFIYGSVQSKQHLNIALQTEVINKKALIPHEIVEIKFQHNGLNEDGLPSYVDLKERKRGFINIENAQIEWIN